MQEATEVDVPGELVPGGQYVQPAAPAKLYVPEGHVGPTALAPGFGQYLPAVQGVQELPAPPGENVPGGHEPPVGDTPPGLLQSCPGGQGVPEARPRIGQCAPIEHCRGLLPPAGQYVPGGQNCAPIFGLNPPDEPL